MKRKKEASQFEDRRTPFPGRPRSSNVRERLISIALQEIANKGGDGFSLNALLKHTRVSKGSFFYHFKNFDDLCLNCFAKCKELIIPELDPGQFRDVRSLLLAFGDETFDRTMSKQFLRLVMFFGSKAMSDSRFLELQKELTELYQESVCSLVLAVDPTLKRKNVLEAIGFLLIVHQGIVSHRIIFRDPSRMKRIWPLSVDAALTIMR